MRILADPNIPLVREAFGPLGRVELVPGRDVTPERVREAEILLVRSVTRVDGRLLAGSRVRFVGSATSGVDHVDLEYLRQAGIPFAHAPGANATAVAEYVIAALLRVAADQARPLAGRSAAVIGCGQVGSRVLARLRALGLDCCANDPPRAEAGEEGPWTDLTAAMETEVVTLHLPLSEGGPHATRGLLDARAVTRLAAGAILVNSARGGVVDEQALGRRLRDGPPLTAVLDCWAGEPAIDLGLARLAAIATPHIAGYSLDGRLRATAMLYRALCAHLGIEERWQPSALDLPPLAAALQLPAGPSEAAIGRLVSDCYDVAADSRRLKATLALGSTARAAAFDRLRRDYPIRREWSAYRVQAPRADPATRGLLRALGFSLST